MKVCATTRLLFCFALVLAVEVVQAEKALPEAQLFAVACAGCHTLSEETDHRIGPPLGNLGNRLAGSVVNYEYSEALATSGIRWTVPELTAWIIDTDARLPETSMVYSNALTPDEIFRLTHWLLKAP